LVEGTGANNSFTLKGGNSTAESAGRLFVSGHACVLDRDITYNGTPVIGIDGQAQRSIFPKITDLSFDSGANQTVITDTSANYITSELVGRNITPNVEAGSPSYAIVSNTSTQIRVAGNITSITDIGKRYRLTLTTPTINRTDYVYVNVFLDEIGGDEDPNLLHNFMVLEESQRRWQIQQYVFVRQGSASPFTAYIDNDGLKHFTALIATINRVAGDPNITSSMPVDRRAIISPVAGPRMTKQKLTISANGQTSFTLAYAPTYVENVSLHISGVDQEYGLTKDFYVIGSTLIWNDRHFALETSDIAYYWFLL
ncbi:MAG: hypothetical protein KKD01_20050, partial [Proteobacteria bacterium]|nr:hypothetical protein [Pseudomonadota bacterium]